MGKRDSSGREVGRNSVVMAMAAGDGSSYAVAAGEGAVLGTVGRRCVQCWRMPWKTRRESFERNDAALRVTAFVQLS
jgi:hypothetical protein